MQDVDLIAKLGDLRETDYKNTLAIASLIELLIEKGIFTRQEFAQKARELDRATVTEIVYRRLHTMGMK